MFSRFKEKRLTDDVHTALDNILLGVKLGELLEFVPTGLNDPSPTIKKNVAVFIERALLITYIDDFEEIKGEILPMIAQVADDKDADVREQGLKTLGICVGRLGQTEL